MYTIFRNKFKELNKIIKQKNLRADVKRTGKFKEKKENIKKSEKIKTTSD